MLESPMYLTDKAVLRLTVGLTTESALWMRREMELAITYYQYREVAIQINSPGGDLSALDGLLADMEHWTATCGVRFSTRAIGEVASAAGLLLAMGTVPYRSATVTSRILLHEPRALLSGRQEVWTREDCRRLGHELDTVNQRMLDRLTEHVWRGRSEGSSLTCRHSDSDRRVAIQSPAELRDYYARAHRDEVWLNAYDACGIGLIDHIDGSCRQPKHDPHIEQTCGRLA